MVFLLGDTIIDYFQHVSKPTNELHRAFVNGWNTSKSNIVHLRCLAVIGCAITWPWLALAGKDLNILDMNRYFHTAREVMQSWHENPLRIMTDEHNVFRQVGTDHEVWKSLCQKGISEDMVHPLKAVLAALLDVVDRQLSKQLSGGKYWEPTPILLEQASSCVSTNISGERNFATLDSRLRRAPNITVRKLESKVMFRRNHKKQSLRN